MPCEVAVTDEFKEWYEDLGEEEQFSVERVVNMLIERGVTLGSPMSSAIEGSRNALRELRIQHDGRPYRVLYAFDPRRMAILLIGGDKTGQGRWYEIFVPKADTLFDEYVMTLRREGIIT